MPGGPAIGGRRPPPNVPFPAVGNIGLQTVAMRPSARTVNSSLGMRDRLPAAP